MKAILLLLCLCGVSVADPPLPGRYSGTLRKSSILPAQTLVVPALMQRVVARLEAGRIHISVPTPSGPDYVSIGSLGADGVFNIRFAGVGVVAGTAVVAKTTIRLTFTHTFTQPDEMGQPVQFEQTYSFTLRRIGP